MSDQTKDFSLQIPKPHPQDECESARILIREGLVDEAKKTLYRVLAHHPKYKLAEELLKQIETLELKNLFEQSGKNKKIVKPEDSASLIEALNQDLGLGLDGLADVDQKEKWNVLTGLTTKEYFDLGIAYFEMDCFVDALREFNKAVNKIRIEQTFLGEDGLMCVSLIAQSLIQLNRAYEAKAYLEPVLIESDLKHEDKLVLYYAMGVAEQALGNNSAARGWLQKTAEIDPDYRDAIFRIRQL